MMREMGWEVDEEVNQDKNGIAGGEATDDIVISMKHLTK